MGGDTMASTHVLLTRFNVRLDESARVPDDAWMRDRLARFEALTVPSVQSQTARPDAWLVFCDAESPRWLATRLGAIDGVSPVPVSGPFGPDVACHAVDTLECGGTMITTRLDSDDVIGVDYLAAIREAAAEGEGFVNFTHGLQLAERRLYRRSDPSNAFISLVERPPLRTVFIGKHHRLAAQGPVRQVRSPPQWLQIIHGGNIANVARGIRTTSRHTARFAVPLEVDDAGVAVDRVRTAAKLAARVMRRPHRLRWAIQVVRR
jgi:hypothetical protein